MIYNYLSEIEKEIAKQKFGSKPQSLYEPIRYIMSMGGKRIRPLFILLAYSLYKRNVKKITPLAIAIEALHNFTLLHDDIMDQAPLRRGRRTVHKKWGINTAILSGDVMLVKVYGLLLQMLPHQLKEGLSKFNACVATVCEGQQLDIMFERRNDISNPEYLNMVRCKTATLLGFSLEFGAFLADAPKQEQKILHEVGIDIGMGFQLADDLLDTYATKKRFGKKIGGDIIANKKTFLLVTALHRVRGKKKKELIDWLHRKPKNPQQKIRAIIDIYDELGIAEYTRKRIRFFFNRGLSKLQEVHGFNTKKEILMEFIKTLIERTK